MLALAINDHARPSYREQSPWRHYQHYFPEEMRCTTDTIPSEEWWQWRGLDVHLDRISTPGSELKVIVLHGAGLIATTLADPRTREARDGLSRNKLLSRVGLPLLSAFRLVLDRLPMPMRLVSKMDRISNDPSLAELCMSDRLGGGSWMPARFLRTMMSTEPAIEPEQFDVCPVLLAHPGVDRMTEIVLSRNFFDRLACQKRMVVLEGAGHFPIEHPGIDQLQEAGLEFLETLNAAGVSRQPD